MGAARYLRDVELRIEQLPAMADAIDSERPRID